MISKISSDYNQLCRLFSFPKKKKKKKKILSTKESQRGSTFFTKFKLLRILLENKEDIYDKEKLAKLYFNCENPNETKKRYVHRIMNIFEKMKLVFSCDENKNIIRKRHKKYWIVAQNVQEILGI